MNSLLIVLALTVLATKQLPELPFSTLVKTECGAHCLECWEQKSVFSSVICGVCEDGYFFNPEKDDSKCVSAVDLDNGRKISGYKRACAQCGLHNYLNSNYDCKPCSPYCDDCSKSNDGTCNKCFTSGKELDNYELVNGECTCVYGNINDRLCKCNKYGYFIDENNEFSCTKCNPCSRNYVSNCPNDIPPHKWDNDLLGCPSACHDVCNECNDDKRDNCREVPSQPFCRNDKLWEEVMINGAKKCLCVCHANEHENMDVSIGEGRNYCQCQDNRVMTDICENNPDCTEQQKLYKFQCVCKNGFHEGDKQANGFVPCVSNEQ